MNRITNRPEYKHHPLYRLLQDCIMANNGGSTSQCFIESVKIRGWRHNFLKWDGAYSLEELTWDNDTVMADLVMIYNR
jgi:hypothetical protein